MRLVYVPQIWVGLEFGLHNWVGSLYGLSSSIQLPLISLGSLAWLLAPLQWGRVSGVASCLGEANSCALPLGWIAGREAKQAELPTMLSGWTGTPGQLRE